MARSPFAEVNGEHTPALLAIHDHIKRGASFDVGHILDKYLRLYPRDGALTLLNDLKRMQKNYANLYEELKRLDPNSFKSDQDEEPSNPNEAHLNSTIEAIRKKYIRLGLVPDDYLPQTKPWEYIKLAKDGIEQFFRSGVRVALEYPAELGRAFRLDPGTTVLFQIQIGLDGGVTVGWERTIK